RGLFARIHLDGPLIFGLMALAAFGLVVLYSAGRQDMDLLTRQAVRLGLGFVVMAVLAQIPTHHFRAWTPWVYGAGVVLLVLVLVAGDIGKGAQRWRDLKIIRFQPSEIMKLAVPMMVAWYLASKALPPRWYHLLAGFLIAAVPLVLILEQPD